jgi:glycine C-acetyltransferase
MAQNFMMDRLETLTERYREGVQAGNYFYESEITAQTPTSVEVDGRQMVMLSSYSYLGLLRHPAIDAAAHDAVNHFGTGTHGVRLLAGTTSLHRQLERRIAAFKGTEDAVVFSSGYVANLATISTLLGRRAVAICDKLDHASIVDACRLSGAEFLRFAHNDMEDLERCLRQSDGRTRLIVIDAVFSMDGDIVDLPSVEALCRQQGAALMVDEAHSVGVLGATGHGIEEHFKLDGSAIDIKMGSLSKTIPGSGGYVAGSRVLIDALKHNARAYIFSGALPPPVAASAIAAFDVIEAEPERVAQLHSKTQRFQLALGTRGFRILHSMTPITALICRTEQQAFDMTRLCRQNGVYVTPVVFPAVPNALPRLRLVVTAALSDEQIDRAVDVLAAAGRVCGLLAQG